MHGIVSSYTQYAKAARRPREYESFDRVDIIAGETVEFL